SQNALGNDLDDGVFPDLTLIFAIYRDLDDKIFGAVGCDRDRFNRSDAKTGERDFRSRVKPFNMREAAIDMEMRPEEALSAAHREDEKDEQAEAHQYKDTQDQVARNPLVHQSVSP